MLHVWGARKICNTFFYVQMAWEWVEQVFPLLTIKLSGVAQWMSTELMKDVLYLSERGLKISTNHMALLLSPR